ncbi:MAG: cysteine desulfurase family protein [Patescibacteria group bacterium]|nr:cysteine desulfurase family protein [Patescibacteria group bacterium]
MAQSIYLDYAAATPIDKTVLAAMQPFLTTEFYNPSATYSAGRQSRQALEAARQEVAVCLGARPSEIVFTAGGTEANNLAVHGVMSQYAASNMVISSIEHSALKKPAAQFATKIAAVGANGVIDLDDLLAKIDDTTVLVSVMYANNEIGTVQPLRAIAGLLATIKKDRLRVGNTLPLLLHTDACQAPNYLDIHTAGLGVDLMTLNGGKIYGPKQTGCLFIKGGTSLTPQITGGGQEHGLRSGTENVAGAVGFARALTLAQHQRNQEVLRLRELQQEFYKQLSGQLPAAIINGSTKVRLPNNVHLTVPGQDNERLLMALDERGIMAAAGSACSASSQTPSDVLASIGLSDELAQASLRFSMGRQTTLAEVTTTVTALAKLVHN